MKAKVTRKWLKESYACVSASYCSLARLLTFRSPDYYTCGIYGWNCDAYKLTSAGRQICLTTGYRGMINNCDNNITHDLCRNYDKKAEIILKNSNKAREDLDSLIAEFVDIVIG